jgi:hypothetical protein
MSKKLCPVVGDFMVSILPNDFQYVMESLLTAVLDLLVQCTVTSFTVISL